MAAGSGSGSLGGGRGRRGCSTGPSPAPGPAVRGLGAGSEQGSTCAPGRHAGARVEDAGLSFKETHPASGLARISMAPSLPPIIAVFQTALDVCVVPEGWFEERREKSGYRGLLEAVGWGRGEVPREGEQTGPPFGVVSKQREASWIYHLPAKLSFLQGVSCI